MLGNFDYHTHLYLGTYARTHPNMHTHLSSRTFRLNHVHALRGFPNFPWKGFPRKISFFNLHYFYLFLVQCSKRWLSFRKLLTFPEVQLLNNSRFENLTNQRTFSTFEFSHYTLCQWIVSTGIFHLSPIIFRILRILLRSIDFTISNLPDFHTEPTNQNNQKCCHFWHGRPFIKREENLYNSLSAKENFQQIQLFDFETEGRLELCIVIYKQSENEKISFRTWKNLFFNKLLQLQVLLKKRLKIPFWQSHFHC